MRPDRLGAQTGACVKHAGEPRPLRREPVEVRGDRVRVAVAAEVGADVLGHDPDDVRPLRGVGQGAGGQQQGGEGEQSHGFSRAPGDGSLGQRPRPPSGRADRRTTMGRGFHPDALPPEWRRHVRRLFCRRSRHRAPAGTNPRRPAVVVIPVVIVLMVAFIYGGIRGGEWLVRRLPARCPACAARAFAEGHRPIRYRCTECGHVHRTTCGRIGRRLI